MEDDSPFSEEKKEKIKKLFAEAILIHETSQRKLIPQKQAQHRRRTWVIEKKIINRQWQGGSCFKDLSARLNKMNSAWEAEENALFAEWTILRDKWPVGQDTSRPWQEAIPTTYRTGLQ